MTKTNDGFARGTCISTDRGHIEIETITGPLLAARALSYDINDRTMGWASVHGGVSVQPEWIPLLVTLIEGTALTLGPGTLVYADGVGFVPASALQIGDAVYLDTTWHQHQDAANYARLADDGAAAPLVPVGPDELGPSRTLVKFIERATMEVDVLFSLALGWPQTYFANGVLVHSQTAAALRRGIDDEHDRDAEAAPTKAPPVVAAQAEAQAGAKDRR